MKQASRELRIVIRASDALSDDLRLVPAHVFKRSFASALAALKAADKETPISGKKRKRSEIFVSHLKMGSNEFGLRGREASVALLDRCVSDVYRSNFEFTARTPALANAVLKLASSYNEGFAIVAQFPESEIPIDAFFLRQTERLTHLMRSDTPLSTARHFAGHAVVAFDGRLGDIDYRGAVWSGHLLLHGSSVQLECIFDRHRGEDAINPFGNKRVTIVGRAIYTGEGPLPERIEVLTIESVPSATEVIDIFRSLRNAHNRAGRS